MLLITDHLCLMVRMIIKSFTAHNDPHHWKHTCQTKCSLIMSVDDRQILSTMVCDAEVKTLAIIASCMLKGNMV